MGFFNKFMEFFSKIFSKFYKCFGYVFGQFTMEGTNSVHDLELNCKSIYMI